jgi:hypothetical protein
MKMKDSLIKRKLRKIVQHNREKRMHNLIGQWSGKKIMVLPAEGTEDNTETLQLTDKLEINPDLGFTWKFCKLGMVKFKENYSKLVFQSQQALGLTKADWEIKKLTFNKLIIQQRTENNQHLEFHFERAFDGYHEG